MFKYFPHTEDDLKEMMERVGVKKAMAFMTIRLLLSFRACCSALSSLHPILPIRQKYRKEPYTTFLSFRA